MSGQDFTTVVSVRIALGLFLVGLVFLSYRVLQPFLIPVAWSIILAYVTWPAYRRLRALLGAYVNTSALLMTLLLAGVFAVPLLWVIALLRTEVPAAYLASVDLVSQGKEALPSYIARLPWIGPEIERLLDLATQDPAALRAQLLQWVKPWTDETLTVLGGISAFGLVGLFLGPIVIVVLLAVWREWLEEQALGEGSFTSSSAGPAAPGSEDHPIPPDA